jgi:hypothetical protein
MLAQACPSEAASVAEDIATRRFYAWAHTHVAEAVDPFAAWHAAWQQGGKHALLCSSELAELVPRLEALTTLFHEAEVELGELEEEEALPF